ncbi:MULTISPECIES: phospholipase D-like domain-containing protein [unclassified Pseudactinotalea]|uniref:phospholipase D-like domain-containing protein n=2 Tax=Micrococcales TaxID=85006 RepID=UPI003C7A3D04
MTNRGPRLQFDLPRPSWTSLGRAAQWWIRIVAAVHLAALVGVVVAEHLRKLRDPYRGVFPRMAPWSTEIAGTKATTFTFGEDLYAAMLDSIRSAEHSIYFETFIWKGDEVGAAFKQALIAAARRGVQVYVVMDTWGNLVVDPRFKRFPKLPTLHLLHFPLFRPGLLTFNLRKTGRDHRKILVVDDEVGYVGGYNIGSLYASTWRDTHLRLEGPATWELANAFVDFWNDHRTARHPELPDQGVKLWEPRIRAAQNAPSRMLFPVRGVYLDAMDRAEHHIYITQAYFIPDREILRGLIAAARRGVDVRVVIPEISNHIVTDWAARSHYTQLLDAGVTLWLFQDAMMHAKTMTVDGRWSTIGTANIDRLSLIGNFEINLELFDAALAQHMEDIFAVDLTNCRQLTAEEWNARSLGHRVLERLIRPFSPLL